MDRGDRDRNGRLEVRLPRTVNWVRTGPVAQSLKIRRRIKMLGAALSPHDVETRSEPPMLQNFGVIAPERMETVAELPYQLHVDHPKGLEIWA
ncbi:hypothetical protein J4G37_32585 [Microvirga sp. 3-52]|nr:hypothetical protein [Microvirga sp. 3-52]